MRYQLTDYEWAAIRPMLPNKPRGVARVDDRVIGPSSLGGGDSRLTLLGLEARLARNAGVLGWILSCWPRRGGTLERGNPARLFSDLPADEEDQRMTRKDWA